MQAYGTADASRVVGVGGNHIKMRALPELKEREAEREPAIGAKLNGDERINSAVKMKAEVGTVPESKEREAEREPDKQNDAKLTKSAGSMNSKPEVRYAS